MRYTKPRGVGLVSYTCFLVVTPFNRGGTPLIRCDCCPPPRRVAFDDDNDDDAPMRFFLLPHLSAAVLTFAYIPCTHCMPRFCTGLRCNRNLIRGQIWTLVDVKLANINAFLCWVQLKLKIGAATFRGFPCRCLTIARESSTHDGCLCDALSGGHLFCIMSKIIERIDVFIPDKCK